MRHFIRAILQPVKWSYASKRINDNEGIVFIKATMGKGWHIYSQTAPDGGPEATSFSFSASNDYKLKGKTSEPEPITRFEKAREVFLSLWIIIFGFLGFLPTWENAFSRRQADAKPKPAKNGAFDDSAFLHLVYDSWFMGSSFEIHFGIFATSGNAGFDVIREKGRQTGYAGFHRSRLCELPEDGSFGMAR